MTRKHAKIVRKNFPGVPASDCLRAKVQSSRAVQTGCACIAQHTKCQPLAIVTEWTPTSTGIFISDHSGGCGSCGAWVAESSMLERIAMSTY